MLSHLTPDQRRALDEATSLVTERYRPWAIIAAGTLVRGEGDERSDIDLYVLHDAPFRQRVQRTFHGVAVEIFVNPEQAVLEYFDEEARDGRPLTAHMLVTGIVRHGNDDPRLGALRDKAREYLEREPSFTDGQLTQARYGAACLFEDALDRREVDPQTAMRLLNRAVDRAVEYWFKARSMNIPRAKAVLDGVDAVEPELGALFRCFWSDASADERWEAALAVADRVLGTRGFFDWESERQEVADAEGD